MAAKQFLQFMNKAPSPYHAVEEFQKSLVAAGFQELKESETWSVKSNEKYFVTRNKSTIIAFGVGGKFEPGNGFTIIGTHTDSPCLKVKPNFDKEKNGYLAVGVECYGGGIWASWFDRDLTIAGRVVVREEENINHRLIHIDRPILRVPNIAIHLQRDINEKFCPNKEKHVQPVLATIARDELERGSKFDKRPILYKLICDELKVKKENILGFDLCLADTQPAVLGGAYEEFIFSSRLDNLLSSYTAIEALIDACKDDGIQDECNILMVSCFDNEEVGSGSAQGAGSSFQEWILRRLSVGGSPTSFEEAIAKSYMLSADQAHAVHPNYSDKHEENHMPAMGKGLVIKTNSNQRYATTGITAAVLHLIGEKAAVPLQEFVVRNDMPCGSTIGPIMAAKLGMATADIGPPQLSMHSIREMSSTCNVLHCLHFYREFLKGFSSIYAKMTF